MSGSTEFESPNLRVSKKLQFSINFSLGDYCSKTKELATLIRAEAGNVSCFVIGFVDTDVANSCAQNRWNFNDFLVLGSILNNSSLIFYLKERETYLDIFENPQ